ncbi:MAG: methyltransferase domain-containing protein [Pseudomonadota bacterium]|nr:methyltransferase domain-containing protein [Pseudomonadota bacterium]
MTLGILAVNAILNNKRNGDDYIPFHIRFQAWWEGEEPNALLIRKYGTAPENPLAIQVDDEAGDDETGLVWPKGRINFCRRLWELDEKDEVVHPGGADYTSWLMKPMNLNHEMSSIDLSAGLGGGTRKTAKSLSTYIDGYEIDPELAALAQELSVKHGMERRAPVSVYNPDELDLPARRFSGVLCRERAYRFRRKDLFLKTAFNSLRPRGHFILTDYVVVNPSDADHPTIRAWMSREPGEFDLWTAEEYRKYMVNLGMDMRITEDETDEYRAMLLQAWSRFVAGLSKQDLTRDFINDMMREAEYWLMLIRALESGKLRYYRYHAIRGIESA